MSNEQTQKVDWASLKFGALWSKDNGRFSGTVTLNGVTKRVIGFPKKSDNNNPNAPDINLHFAPDDSPAQNPQPAKAQASNKTQVPKATAKTAQSPVQVQSDNNDPLL